MILRATPQVNAGLRGIYVFTKIVMEYIIRVTVHTISNIIAEAIPRAGHTPPVDHRLCVRTGSALRAQTPPNVRGV